MRDFFIRSLELIITAVIVLGVIAVFIAGLVTMFSGQGGFIAGLGIWVFGGINIVVVGGMAYLMLGIHDNTRRTADAIERLSLGASQR